MKLLKKEYLVLAVTFLVAIAGLTQILHEDANAVVICELQCQDPIYDCGSQSCKCAGSTKFTTCATWCANHSECPPYE